MDSYLCLAALRFLPETARAAGHFQTSQDTPPTRMLSHQPAKPLRKVALELDQLSRAGLVGDKDAQGARQIVVSTSRPLSDPEALSLIFFQTLPPCGMASIFASHTKVREGLFKQLPSHDLIPGRIWAELFDLVDVLHIVKLQGPLFLRSRVLRNPPSKNLKREPSSLG